ncbi:hypothetical protein B0H10DRAFT_259443 [Mycena sp. CBHHK59/15]|nr:hypothetical protein B0H10DRAFT_259443 [Mycena sp. CBHHK59/15]
MGETSHMTAGTCPDPAYRDIFSAVQAGYAEWAREKSGISYGDVRQGTKLGCDCGLVDALLARLVGGSLLKKLGCDCVLVDALLARLVGGSLLKKLGCDCVFVDALLACLVGGSLLKKLGCDCGFVDALLARLDVIAALWMPSLLVGCDCSCEDTLLACSSWTSLGEFGTRWSTVRTRAGALKHLGMTYLMVLAVRLDISSPILPALHLVGHATFRPQRGVRLLCIF